MKRANIILWTLLSGVMYFTSCNYLDVVPPEQADIPDMMIDDNTALQNLYSCYGYAQNGGCDQPDNAHFDFGSDEVVNPQEWLNFGSRIQWNSITSTSINNDGGYPWKVWYNAIGYCNQFLELISNPNLDLNPNNKAQYIGEVNFLKAFYHFRALETFGPIPIIDKQQSANISKSDIPGRSHFDYCVKYIDSLLTSAEGVLPDTYVNDSYYGRATTIACKALRARMLVLAASPLWNGEFPDKSWKNTTYQTPGYGLELVSHSYDKNKWVKAREACLTAIKAAEQTGHKLFGIEESEQIRKNQNLPLPVIPGNNDEAFKERVIMLRYLMCTRPDQGNTEVIWGIPQTSDNNFVLPSVPHYVMYSNQGYILGCWGGMSPTLYTVQHFFTKEGKLPADDPTFAKASTWYKSAGLDNPDIINLNVNREPRFYAWISFDGDQYSSVFANRSPVYCEFRNHEHTGYDAQIHGTRNYSVTGYLNKKWVHPNLSYTGNSWNNNFKANQAPLSIFRLADLYLLLAECDAHLGTEYVGEALEYLNKVRSRAGIPSITAESLNANHTLLQDILDERFVEMYAEGSRYYDIRRYVQGSKYLSADNFMGLNAMIKSPSFNQFNTPTKINQPFDWDDRLYLLPIPDGEVYSNPQMVQAPGY